MTKDELSKKMMRGAKIVDTYNQLIELYAQTTREMEGVDQTGHDYCELKGKRIGLELAMKAIEERFELEV